MFAANSLGNLKRYIWKKQREKKKRYISPKEKIDVLEEAVSGLDFDTGEHA